MALDASRLSLKTQIVLAYGLMAALVCAISVTLSLFMLRSLKENVDSESTNIVLSQASTTAGDLARGIADTAAEKFTIIGESMNKVSAGYSKILLTSTDLYVTKPPFQRLAAFPSYPEFDFASGCVLLQKCPDDFGPLQERSRFPYITALQNGSLLHSSTYVYSSATNSAAKTRAAWNSTFFASPALTAVRDAQAVQDGDQSAMYSFGPANNLMFYLSTKVTTNGTGQYYALHRTYPGIPKAGNTYDPTIRPWFKGARSDVVQFYGPYVETFTHQQVVTLSFKKSFPYSNHSVEVVSAAAVLVDSFRTLVTSVPFVDDGFGVIFNKWNRRVMAWGNRTDLVDANTNAFRTLQNVDPNLPNNVCDEPTFEYEDSAGTIWLGACADAFNATVADVPGTGSGGAVGNTLTVMVFAQKALAEKPLLSLRSRMDDAATNLTSEVLILVLGLSGVVMLLVLAVVWNITSTLDQMRFVAQQVVAVMHEDEEVRDFAPVLNKAAFNVLRTDEVGVLACDFYSVMCLMHNKVVKKHSAPRHPPNPWRLDCDDDQDPVRASVLTWQDLRTVAARVDAQKEAVSREVVVAQSSSLSLGPALLPSSTASASSVVASIAPSSKTASLDALRSSSLPSVPKLQIGKVVPWSASQLATVVHSQPVGWLTCLKTQLATLAALLVLGVVGTMLVMVFKVQSEGSSWTDEAAADMVDDTATILGALVDMKATLVEAFFEQMSVDMLTAGVFYASLLRGNLTTASWQADGAYFQSYSIDPSNPYSINPHGSTFPFSGYFIAADVECAQASPPSCAAVHDAEQTRLTSLLDVKMESLFYPNSYLSFVQIAMEDTGFTRYWPYRYSTANSAPTSCPVQVTDVALCSDLFTHTKCGNLSLPSYSYEARCRSWYGLARQQPSATVPSFQHPRVSTLGDYVLTSVLNIAHPVTGNRLAVLNQNFLVSSLANSVNKSPILTSGYSYLVDRADLDSVVLHPQQTLNCGTLRCAEGMTAEEYAALKSSVLQVDSAAAATTYAKAGTLWHVATRSVRYGSVDYLLVGTVSNDEVLAFAAKPIDESTQQMAVGFGVAIAVVVACMVLAIAKMVRAITRPLDDLREVIRLALHKDFTKELPKQAGSSDMTALMHAVTQLLVALRLSELNGSTDARRTRAVFEDSVGLFAATGNGKALGTSLSNLAALELSVGRSAAAQQHYVRAIDLAKEQVALLESASRGAQAGDEEAPPINSSEEALRRARRLASDRQGRLAVALLERQEVSAAVELLDQLLLEDTRQLHVCGCVEKQSSLGRAYLRQKLLPEAERVFAASLTLIRELQRSVSVCGSAVSEADAYEMSVLCDLAVLENARDWHTTLERLQALEHKYLEALMAPALLQPRAAKRILRDLLSLYSRHPQFAEARRLVQRIADSHRQVLATEDMAAARRVVLVLDYSSSMAGTRIRSLKDGLHAFAKQHLQAHDSVAILSFNNSVQEVHALTPLGESCTHLAKRVESLVAPVGGTALYDGVQRALVALNRDPTPSDWVVVVSDGADDKSKVALEQLLQALAASHVSMVALGVGAEAPEEVLLRLTQAARRGFCVCAPASRADIADLFEETARLLETLHVALEDY